MEELKIKMCELFNLYLDEPDPKEDMPLPDNTLNGDNISSVEVEPKIAFAILLKHTKKSIIIILNKRKWQRKWDIKIFGVIRCWKLLIKQIRDFQH